MSEESLAASAGLIVVISILATWRCDENDLKGLHDDDTFGGKLLNRIYFTTSTLSTVGYGDITPQSAYAKIIAIILHTVGFLSLYVAIYSKTAQLTTAAASKLNLVEKEK